MFNKNKTHMTTKQKYAVILGNLGNTCDRFLSSGYKDVPGRDELLDQAAAIDGVTGIELVATWDITRETAPHMKKMLDAIIDDKRQFLQSLAEIDPKRLIPSRRDFLAAIDVVSQADFSDRTLQVIAELKAKSP